MSVCMSQWGQSVYVSLCQSDTFADFVVTTDRACVRVRARVLMCMYVCLCYWYICWWWLIMYVCMYQWGPSVCVCVSVSSDTFADFEAMTDHVCMCVCLIEVRLCVCVFLCRVIHLLTLRWWLTVWCLRSCTTSTCTAWNRHVSGSRLSHYCCLLLLILSESVCDYRHQSLWKNFMIC